MPLTKPDALLFDLDGLMVDSEPLYQRAWVLAGKDLGVSISDALYLSCIGQRPAENIRCLRATFGEDFAGEHFWQLRSEYWHQIVQHEGIPLKKGVLNLLETLLQHQIPVAIATSNDRKTALFSLEHAKLSDCYTALVTGEQVKNGKPAPDIFIAAAQQLNADPARCWALEDSYHGISAGFHAGCQTVWVPDLLGPAAQVLSQTTQQCVDLDEVNQILLGLLG